MIRRAADAEADAIQREAGHHRTSSSRLLSHRSTNNLGELLRGKGDLAAAEPLLRKALKVRRATLGERHPDTLISINNLGVLLQAKGDLAAAEPQALLREALEGQRETLGDFHPHTLTSRNRLGALLQKMEDLTFTEG